MLCCVKYFMNKSQIRAGTFPGKVYILQISFKIRSNVYSLLVILVKNVFLFFSFKFFDKDLKKQMVYAESLIPKSTVNSVKLLTVLKCQM